LIEYVYIAKSVQGTAAGASRFFLILLILPAPPRSLQDQEVEVFSLRVRFSIAPILLMWLTAAVPRLFGQAGGAVPDQPSVTHQLLAVTYPERGTVTMDMEGTPRLPDARGDVKVQRRDAMSRVEIRMDRMRPASLFGGDYVIYVAWAVSPEGQASNLGPLNVSGSKARLRSKTPLTAFGVLVTAEPHFLVQSPSRFVVAQNGRPGRRAEDVRMARIEYQGTDGQYQATRDSLVGLPEVRGEVQTDIMEARAALLLAERAGAPEFAASDYQAARLALEKAEQEIKNRPRDRDRERLSREAVRLAAAAHLRAEEQRIRLALTAPQRSPQEELRMETGEEEAVRAEQPASPEPLTAPTPQADLDEADPPPPAPDMEREAREDHMGETSATPPQPDREALQREAEQQQLLRQAEERVREAERFAREAEVHARQAEDRARQAAASEAETVRRDADQAQAEADRARRELELAQGEAEQARGDAERARQHVEQLQRSLDEERLARQTAESQVETARQEAGRIQAETERVLRQAEQTRVEAERSQREAEEMRQQAAQARDEALRMREQAEQWQREAEDMRQQAEAARQQAEQAQQQAQQAQAERERVRQELRDALSRIVEIRESAEGLILNLPGISFEFGSATLTTDARESLSKVAGILQVTEGYQISIEGHTDSIGSPEINQELSQQRAQNVREYLIERGLSPERIVSVEGLGPDRPVADNQTAEGRQQNRRVEIVLQEAEPAAVAE
jgi:outer membrane protein OmpA-like peptidoglycan-associated protein